MVKVVYNDKLVYKVVLWVFFLFSLWKENVALNISLPICIGSLSWHSHNVVIWVFFGISWWTENVALREDGVIIILSSHIVGAQSGE